MKVPSRIKNAVNETRVRALRELRSMNPEFAALLDGTTTNLTSEERSLQMAAILEHPDMEQILCSHLVGMFEKLRGEGWDDDQILAGVKEPNPKR